MRVLITGATGFLGSYVLRSLVDSGAHEVAFVARPSAHLWRIADVAPRATCIRADLERIEGAREAVAGFRPDVVIHLAWSGVGNALRNDPAQIDNLRVTLAVVAVAHEAGARHFVGLGSQAEYGPCSGAIDESAPTRPTSLYGVSKLATGVFARHACEERGVRFAWVRLFSAYGPMDDPAWMISSLVLQLLARRRPPLTLGEQRWDYVYAADAADAVVRVALEPEARGIFNLGSGQAHTIRYVAESIRDLVDPQLPLGFGEVPYRPDQVMHLEARVERLRALGWSSATPLDRGLKETVAWYRDHQSRYASAAS
jgi:nucleoside-diphosphate-sugar epimerase